MSESVSAARCGTYTDLAGEYYDAQRHPTSANFREASAILLVDWLNEELASRVIWEVGAGASLVAEIYAARGWSLTNLVISDTSSAMLEYSRMWDAHGARFELADAERLPLADASIDVLVSVLGDPYNTDAFWTEVSRVLKDQGSCIFTTPSFQWSETFRSQAGEPAMCAEFELETGARLRVPSFIYAIDRQIAMLTRRGLDVSEVKGVSLEALGGPISPKLVAPYGANGTVVVGYLARRRTRGP